MRHSLDFLLFLGFSSLNSITPLRCIFSIFSTLLDAGVEIRLDQPFCEFLLEFKLFSSSCFMANNLEILNINLQFYNIFLVITCVVHARAQGTSRPYTCQLCDWCMINYTQPKNSSNFPLFYFINYII